MARALVKTSLDHLPHDRRAKIQAMAAKIRALAPQADMIVLFGSHARGNWVSDLGTGYMSDYDLLVIVETPELAEDALWSRVSQEIQPFAQPSYAQLIVHDFRFVNEQIRRGQFFWVEIWQQGVVLHDSRRFTLARPKAATPEERRALAQEYFDHWFTSAVEFFESSKLVLTLQKQRNIAAFLLHQSAERYFATALLIFTGTKPLLHDLEKLVEKVAPLHPLLAEPFPMATEEDRRLFKLLKKAYIESRYSKSYRITDDELRVLGERVQDFGARVERACREKIASFA